MTNTSGNIRSPITDNRPLITDHRSLTTGNRHWIFPILVVALAALFLLDLMTGSVGIGPGQVLHILFGGEAQRASWEKIIWLFRLPKAITAILAGAGLALSGLLLQNLFRNPLAGPSVLGINAGASLGVAIIVLISASGSAGPRFVADMGLSGKAAMVVCAGIGAGAVLTVIMALARRVKDVMSLLIIGILCGFAVNATVSVLIHFSVAERIQSYLSWTFGSFAAVTWNDLGLFAPILLFGLTGCLLIRKPLNGLLLGETYARSMGLHVNRIRLVVIFLTAILAGTVTAFCGPVTFIGVAVPHLGRLVSGSADHRSLLPATALLGSLTALAADLLAQFPGSQAVLPLNAVTALLGAPVIVWLILRRNNLHKLF